ncbi:DUF4132 domain-containing protein [Flagellimonas sp.]|uniref:DUF4132 domain-containing protein n=1 Tax=Flagellimonas sp. TaxID=2058762 RepID=UPI003BA99D94
MKKTFFKSQGSMYWIIEVLNTEYEIQYSTGRRDPKIISKSFESAQECREHAEKEIDSKLSEGYFELTMAAKAPNAKPFDVWLIQKAQQEGQKELSFTLDNPLELWDEIFKINTLEKLQIELDIIPSEIIGIRDLQNLKILEVNLKDEYFLGRSVFIEWDKLFKGKNIAALEEGIGQLQNLEEYRSNTFVPKSIGNLKKLQTIQIEIKRGKSFTMPSKLPDSLAQLIHLKRIEISGVEVDYLPDSFADLQQLEVLHLWSSTFKEVPKVIYSLSSLRELKLNWNSIDVLPKALAEVPDLDISLFGFETFTNVPKEIVNEGWESVKKYLLGLYPKGKILPPLSPEEKQNIWEERKEQLNAFKRECIYARQFEQVLSFITGESDECPLGHEDDVYGHKEIVEVLLPLEQWGPVDQRILTFITQEESFFYIEKTYNKYESGFYQELVDRWLIGQVRDFPEVPFTAVLTALEPYGITKDFLVPKCFIKVPFALEDGRPTAFGRYILENLEVELDQYVEWAINGNTQRFVKFIVEQEDPAYMALLEPHIHKFLTYGDPDKHIQFHIFRSLCAYKAKHYCEVLWETLQATMGHYCYRCETYSAEILERYGNGAYREHTLNIFTKALAHKLKGDYDVASKAQLARWMHGFYGEEALPILEEHVRQTKEMDLRVVNVAVECYGNQANAIIEEAFKIDYRSEADDHFEELLNILNKVDWTPFVEQIWELLEGTRSHKVALMACSKLRQLGAEAVLPRARKLLDDKGMRPYAIRLMLSYTEGQKEILPLLETEADEDLRNIVVRHVYSRPEQIDMEEARSRIVKAVKRKKLSRLPAKWLNLASMPPLQWKDGTSLTEEETIYLFYRQRSWGDLSVDPEARDLYPLIERNGAFAAQLLELILNNGGVLAKNYFALPVLGLLADNSIVDTLSDMAIKQKKKQVCAVLGLIGTLEAARTLDHIAQHFATKYPQVLEAAQEGFLEVAEQRKMTPEELLDAIMPDFGFTGLSTTLTDGKESYEVTIDKSLKLAFQTAEGKVSKSIAKPSTKMKALLKPLQGELKKAIKQFVPNLEAALANQRAWLVPDWEQHFLHNPFAFALAQNFIWGLYHGDALQQDFAVHDGGMLLDVEGNTVVLDKDMVVRLIHPLLMDEASLTKWKAYLKKEKISPPFAQVDRSVFAPNEDQAEKTMSRDYEERTITDYTFKSRAEKRGWRRGSVVDGGEIASYKKDYPIYNIEAFLGVRGFAVQSGYNFDGDITKVYFVQTGSVRIGGYDEPRFENDHRLIPFGEVPPLVYSETIKDVEEIVG